MNFKVPAGRPAIVEYNKHYPHEDEEPDAKNPSGKSGKKVPSGSKKKGSGGP
jgi:hypothetical protein